MKTLSYCFIAVALILLSACSNEKTNASEVIQHNEPMTLSLEDGPIQNVALVDGIDMEEENPVAKQMNEAPQKPKPKRIVNQAPKKTMEALLVEVAQVAEQGATDEEAAAVYVEYADSLAEQGMYFPAIETYKIAEDKHYKDLKTLCYKIARTYALSGERYGAMEDYLVKARALGFRNYRALLYDEAFKEWRDDYEFMYLYDRLFGENKKAMFKAFVYFAPKTNLKKDFVVDPVALYENVNYDYRDKSGYYDAKPYISGYFDDFVEGVSDGMFSREGGDNFRYEMVLKQNKNYIAVLYSKEEEWSEFILPKSYVLVTFDRTGNKISELEVAKRGSLKRGKGFVFHPDNNFEVTKYKVTWKEAAKKRYQEDEKYMTHKDLESTVVVSEQSYMIGGDGKIVETEGLVLGMR